MKQQPISPDKETYIQNRIHRLEEFKDILNSPKSEFVIDRIFKIIIDQERFLLHLQKHGHPHTNYKDEKEFLITLIYGAEKVFLKEYQKLYEKVLKETPNHLYKI